MESHEPFNKHLVAWRKHKRMSGTQLAQILGVDKSTISRWETGERTLDLNDLSRLAAVYEVHPVALLLAPENVALARKLTDALGVLAGTSDEVAERWLATGRDLASVSKK